MKFRVAFLLSLLVGAPSAFAQSGETINQLSPGTALRGNELIPMYQGSNPAVTTTPSAIATYTNATAGNYPSGFNTVDATKYSGADMCAKISAAAAAPPNSFPEGGTIDARGVTGTDKWPGNIIANWPGGGA